MRKRQGKLVVILQALSPGIRPGPYKIEVFKPRQPSTARPVAVSRVSVLGSPTTFSLSPGKYRIVVSHPKEGSFSRETSVMLNKETVLPIRIGRPLARGYRDLLLEVRDHEREFESFLLKLGKDARLQTAFVKGPDKVLRQAGLLKKGMSLSRNNRLFISMLANTKFRKLIRLGPGQVKVPKVYFQTHKEKMQRLAKKVLPAHRHLSPETVQRMIQQRYYLQDMLEQILTDPVIEELYHVRIERPSVDRLIDNMYDFIDRSVAVPAAVEAGIPAIDVLVNTSVISGLVGGTGIYLIFTPASQDTDLSFGFGVGVSEETAIFVDSYIFTEDTIFTKTKVFCDLRPHPDIEPGITDQFEHFEDFTVTDELGAAFGLDQFQVNEIFNTALIADAIVEGMRYFDYGAALDVARQQGNLPPIG